jgi:hypothetical protein
MGTVAAVPLMLPTVARCRRCNARVRWVTCLGRPLPIDAEPSPDGRLVLELIDGEWVAQRRRPYRALALRMDGHQLYAAHTCDQEK